MNETVVYFIKILGMFLLILLLVFLLAVITPKLAKIVDNFINKIFKNKTLNNNDDIYKVRSIYDLPKDNQIDKQLSENNNVNEGESENGEK